MKFRKKPVVIEAVQLTWQTWNEVCDLIESASTQGEKPYGFNPDGDLDVIGLKIPTLDGVMEAKQGDWIIRGINGELYPCKPDIFEKTYEPVEDQDSPIASA